MPLVALNGLPPNRIIHNPMNYSPKITKILYTSIQLTIKKEYSITLTYLAPSLSKVAAPERALTKFLSPSDAKAFQPYGHFSRTRLASLQTISRPSHSPPPHTSPSLDRISTLTALTPHTPLAACHTPPSPPATMAQYYPQPPQQGYNPSNLQFYPSTYPQPVSGHTTPSQAHYYGQQSPGSSQAYGGASGFGPAPTFGPGVSGRMGEQGGLRTGWLAAFGTEGYDGEPPLLEELGVNFGHIKGKVSLATLLYQSFNRPPICLSYSNISPPHTDPHST